ncbi:epiphycan [Apteryx mantelli]|uniref:Epiphycan n=1 Tax=Apteryx mantelli TaxID=2696672 RepID=A0A8B7IV59_9AVES|nr:PREDICTED: epiphycan [Apteryx mantelli mantelli]XP_025914231.1 epiphycan [Apteryx rowi]
MKTFVNIFLGFFIFESVGAAPTADTETYDSEFYEVPLGELLHPFVYVENEQSDQLETEIGTALPSVTQESYSFALLTEEPEEEASTPKLIDGSSAQGSDVLGLQTHDGLPTCLLCTCLGTTVYCDDRELDVVPPLPKKTMYFYSRYNRIRKINRNDFANLSNLKRIDLTANFISEIHEDAFWILPQLQELVLRENRIRQLPELPSTLTFIDISNNRLGRRGIRNEAFKDLHELQHLYITDNNLDHIPLPLPESLQALHLQNNNIQEMHEDTFCDTKDFNYVRRALEDIRLDGNPINLSKTPYAYMCLPRLPVGNLM